MRNYIFIKDLEVLKEELKSKKLVQYKRLKAECDRYFSYYLPEDHPAQSTTYMGIALYNLSLMSLVSDNEKYLLEAKRFIKAVCNYPKWGNAHLVNVDLSASWILFGLSVSYNYLEDLLDSETKKLVYDKLIIQANIMYDYKVDTEGHGWSTNYFQNHNWINMTSLAAFGYALKDEYADAKKFSDISLENFKTVYSLLPEDGSNYEGVVYWRYGGMWLFVYAALVKDQEQIDFFKTCKYLENTVKYRIYQASSSLEKQVNFGDCHDRYSGHSAAVYYLVASEFNDEHAMYLGNKVTNEFLFSEQFNSHVKPGILPEAGFELVWYNDSVKEHDFSDLSLTAYFKDLGLVTVRDSFEPNAKVFSFKCGAPGGAKQWELANKLEQEKDYKILSLSHNHPDNLSFLLLRDDEYYLIDEGYNRNIKPDNHSVLLVDDTMCRVHDVNDVYTSSYRSELEKNKDFDFSKFVGKFNFFEENNKTTIFEAEASGIYDSDLEMNNVSRLVLTNNLDYILTLDNLNSNLEHKYSKIFNFDNKAEKVGDKLIIKGLKDNLECSYFSDRSTEQESYIQTVKAVMTTQEPNNFCMSYLYTSKEEGTSKVKDQKFISLFNFDDTKVEKDITKELIKIKTSNYTDYLFLNSNDKVSFDGSYLYLSVNNKNEITKLTIIDGSYVDLGGKRIISGTKGNINRGIINELFK